MEQKTLLALVLVTYITLVSLGSATGRSHGLKYHHHYHSHLHNSNHNRNHHPHTQEVGDQESTFQKKQVKSTSTPWRLSDDDYEYDDDAGRHAYLMNEDNKKSSSERVQTEDQTLTQAFEKHMKPGATNIHDCYAYQLPSDLWFVVRYAKNEDGQVEKYMNVVSSFTNYLEKLDKDVRTVSVNVKGVETVFRLTPKRKPDN